MDELLKRIEELERENELLKVELKKVETSFYALGVFREYTDLNHEASWAFQIDPPMPINITAEQQLQWIFTNSKLIEASDNYLKLNGYDSLHQIINKSIDKVWKGTMEELRDALSRFIDRKYQAIRLELIRKAPDGSNKWLDMVAYGVFEDVGMTAIVGTQLDITEKKNALLQLSESETRFRNIINHAVDAVYLIAEDGQIKEVNKQAAIQTGYTKEELVQLNAIEIDATFKDVSEIQNIWNQLKIGESSSLESIHKRKDGDTYSVEIHLSKVKMHDDIYILAFVRDFTDRQVLINELKTKNEELEAYTEELEATTAALRNSNKDLEVAIKHAQESDRLKTAFLQNMSHEIRTPLNGILGFSSILKEQINDEEASYYTDIIVKSGEQLLGIVDDIVDLSKIETGQVVLKRELFDVKEALLELYHFFLPQMEEKGLDFKLVLSNQQSECQIDTDRTKFKQVFSNLLKNAVKFTHEGFVQFGFHIANQRIKFFVTDSGIGIDPSMHKLIFERFSQVESGLSRGYGGTGLGLTISQAFIEIMGGTIEVNSQLGQGTSFTFDFPCSLIKVENNNLKERFLKTLSGITVLVVEDEQINAQYIEDVLKKYNVKTLIAINGKEALQIFKDYPEIDIVLMDIRMPGMNGYEVTNIIKSRNPEALVIAQTAFAMAEDRHKAMEAGFDDYIAKPMLKENLLLILEKHLKNRK